MSQIREILEPARKILKSKLYRDAVDELKRNPSYEPVRMVQTPDISAVDLYMLEKLDNIKQPDWNQNDENAPDFIKNRICYTTYDVTSIILQFNESGSAIVGATFEFAEPIFSNYTDSFILVCDDSDIYSSFDGMSGAPDFSSGGGGGMLYTSNGATIGTWSFSFSTVNTTWKISFNVAGNTTILKNKIFVPTIIRHEKIKDTYIPDTVVRTSQLGGAIFKIVSGTLQASLDGGSTWKTVTLA